MKFNVELTEYDLKQLVLTHINKLIDAPVNIKDISFKVKTKQNYKAEWEEGEFRATYSGNY